MVDYIGKVAPGSTRQEIIIYSSDSIETDYILIKEGNKRYIYEVNAIETFNERLQDTAYFRIMREGDDYSKYNIFKTNASFIGVLEGNKIGNDFFYIASPGTKVYKTEIEDIKKIFDISEEFDRIKIGTFYRQNNITVNINFEKLLSTHASVLGRTGSGKTFFVSNLLTKLKSKYIVISPENEYKDLINNLDLFNCNDIPVGVDISKCKSAFGFNESEYLYFHQYQSTIKNLESISSIRLAEDIRSYYDVLYQDKQQTFFTVEINKKKIELQRDIASLCDKLIDTNIEIFLKEKQHNNNNYPIIFSTEGLNEFAEKISVNTFLSTLLKNRKIEYRCSNNKLDNIYIVLEEAHNYAPSVKTTKCKDIIVQIAREGRKYGLHLLVLSQRPRHIDQTLLSQCGTNIIFNLPNPQDIEYVMEHTSFYSEKSKKTIQNLRRGECIITSNIRKNDIICNVSF